MAFTVKEEILIICYFSYEKQMILWNFQAILLETIAHTLENSELV